MPWNWGGKSSWPNYEAAYLAKRLGVDADEAKRAEDNRFDQGLVNALPASEAAVYLDKVGSNYKEEADQCLKAEFVQWLEGRHEDNGDPQVYTGGPGKLNRRSVYGAYERTQGYVPAGGVLREWRPTWWHKDQLTHLDGVREFLREKAVSAEEHEFALNVLAEHGPQNIAQAWTYFKHWVKGMPVSPEDCVYKPDVLPEGQVGPFEGVDRSTPTSMAHQRWQHIYGTNSDESGLALYNAKAEYKDAQLKREQAERKLTDTIVSNDSILLFPEQFAEKRREFQAAKKEEDRAVADLSKQKHFIERGARHSNHLAANYLIKKRPATGEPLNAAADEIVREGTGAFAKAVPLPEELRSDFEEAFNAFNLEAFNLEEAAINLEEAANEPIVTEGPNDDL